MSEVVRRVDERDVRERLREVADEALCLGIVLLGQQPDVVSQAKQSLEQLTGIVRATAE